MYLFLGQFTVPSVSGQCCPPTVDFTINKINQNKGIMVGGAVANNGHHIPTNNMYIFNVTRNAIVSYYYVHVQYTCTCVLSHSKLKMVIRNVINTKPLFNAHSMLLSVRAIDAEFCDTKSQTKVK